MSIHYIANISVSSADCLTHHLPQDASLKQKYFYQEVFSWARVFLQETSWNHSWKARCAALVRTCDCRWEVGKDFTILIFPWANLFKQGKVQWGQPHVKHQPVKQGQTTTPGTPCPTLYDKCMGSLKSPADYITLKMEEMGPTIYHPYPRRLETSYHLQMSLQRQHVLLSYFKTLSVGPVWGSNPRPPAQQSGALPTELTG